MRCTLKQTNWKRFLAAALALATVALMATSGTTALAADVPQRAQLDAGITDPVGPIDAGMIEVDAGVPELQGAMHGALQRNKNVPE